MIIDSIAIAHLRCLESLNVDLGPYTIIVGPNGVGKSTILDAIRFLCDGSHRIKPSDLNVSMPDMPLEVTGTFSYLSSVDRETWADFVDANDRITITKSASYDIDSGSWTISYTGVTQAYPGFQAVRSLLGGQKMVFKAEYNLLAKRDDSDLPVVTTWAAGEEALRLWEIRHPADCTPTRVSIAAKDAQQRFLDTLKVVVIAAVPEVNAALNGRGAILTTLVDQMVIPRIEEDPRLNDLRQIVEDAYRTIFPTDGSTELDTAEELINESLALFAPGSSFNLRWNPDSQPSIEPPTYETDIVEDGVASPVESKGHGVQRAIIVSMIHALHARNMASLPSQDASVVGPSTMLLIEEPELYQHPTRARHLAHVLRSLTDSTSNPRLQIILTTHSPFLVHLSDFAAIRVLRRGLSITGRSTPPRLIQSTTLQRVSEELALSYSGATKPLSDAVISAKVDAALTGDVRECFFADAVVLVEGESDRAAVLAALELRGASADALAISVLAVDGKTNLDAILVILKQLGLPTFVIFDGDTNESTDVNARLMKILGLTPELHPKTQIGTNFAIFEADRETTVLQELGEEYTSALESVCDSYGFKTKKGEKKPAIVSQVYKELAARGITSGSLESIATAILRLGERAAITATGAAKLS